MHHVSGSMWCSYRLQNVQFFKFDASFLLLLMDIWPRVQENSLTNRDSRMGNTQSLAHLSSVTHAIQTVLSRKAYRNWQEWLKKNRPEVFVKSSTNPLLSSLTGEHFMNTIAEIFSLEAGGNPTIADRQLRSWDANKDKLSLTLNSIEHPLVYTGRDIPGLEADICIEKLITVAVASSDAWALVCRGRPLNLNGRRTTWMHWPTEQTAAVMQGFFIMLDPAAELRLGADQNADYIELGLQFLSFLDRPSESCLQQSEVWIRRCDQRGIKCFIRKNPEHRDGNFERYPMIKSELFAYFLTQSPSWLTSTIRNQAFNDTFICSEHQVSFLYEATISDQEHNPELSPDATMVLKMLMSFIYIVIDSMQPSVGANDAEYHSWRPRMVKIENEIGLVMAPPKATIRLAAPNAIRAVACQNLSRCWILEPIESRSGEGQGWRLLGKSLIYAPPGFATVLGQTDSSGLPQRVFGAATAVKTYYLGELKGHGDSINCVAFSPDGTTIASSSDDRSVRIWYAATGEQLRELKGHEDKVSGVAFSPDGNIIASCSDDRSVRTWAAAV